MWGGEAIENIGLDRAAAWLNEVRAGREKGLGELFHKPGVY
jgi:hypothetical protein